MSRKRAAVRSRRDNVYDFEDAYLANARAQEQGPKRKHWTTHDLKSVKPLTPTQREMFHDFFSGQHICAHGSAGTGKSFVAIYLALSEVLNKSTPVDKIIIIRSAVTTRDQGFLPGTQEEKNQPFETPYKDIFADICGKVNTYEDMKEAGLVQFCTSAHVRGLTWDNAIVVVDEIQNMTWAEIDSIVTRVGQNTRLIMCGDSKHQLDLTGKEKTGFAEMLCIIQRMNAFSEISFTHHDIVRSEFVKQWIITRDELNL